MSADDLTERAAAVLGAFRMRGWRLATAESCTGGMIATCLTAIPGSSEVVERGFITYSNEAKVEMLGVSENLLREAGAVSEVVAVAMAEGGLARARAEVCVAATGLAGPGGETLDKPVGLVHMACAGSHGETVHLRRVFDGDRAAVRRQTVAAALRLLEQAVATQK